MAFTPCARATRPTGAPGSNISSMIRRFSATRQKRRFFDSQPSLGSLAPSVHISPSWTIPVVPTGAHFPNPLTRRLGVQTVSLPRNILYVVHLISYLGKNSEHKAVEALAGNHADSFAGDSADLEGR